MAQPSEPLASDLLDETVDEAMSKYRRSLREWRKSVERMTECAIDVAEKTGEFDARKVAEQIKKRRG